MPKIPQIFIVEDDLAIAHGLQEFLPSIGFEVPYISSSGPDAIQWVKDHQPDLILMDLKLSGDMDGVAIAKNIRFFADIPILFISGYADTPTLDRIQKISSARIILKPFDLAKLGNTMKDMLT
ncbi:MAG: response regulator [Candidatus Omnitrophica bacterium]|nr:response regulator [Candidatus Omnitrophota bacterium]